MEMKQEIIKNLDGVSRKIWAFNTAWTEGIITDAEASQKIEGLKRDLVTIQVKMQELLDGNGKTASGE